MVSERVGRQAHGILKVCSRYRGHELGLGTQGVSLCKNRLSLLSFSLQEREDHRGSEPRRSTNEGDC